MAAPTPTKPRTSKGPRPKHVPQRMCVSCRDHAAKRTLTRIVRTPEGVVETDPTGKRNGRGAYLCDRPPCWDRALSTGALARALKTTIDADVADRLRQHAVALPAQVEPDAAARPSQKE